MPVDGGYGILEKFILLKMVLEAHSKMWSQDEGRKETQRGNMVT